MAGETQPQVVVENGAVAQDSTAGAQAVTDTHATTEAAAGGHEAVGFPPFDASTFGSQLLWLAITFGALYVIMARVALPRIGEILEVRQDRIESDLAEADRMRQRTDQAVEAYEKELAEARQKAHGIAEQTRADNSAAADARRAEVEAELSKQVATAEARIQATKTEALKNVDAIAADTAAALVGQIAGKVSAAEAASAVKKVLEG